MPPKLRWFLGLVVLLAGCHSQTNTSIPPESAAATYTVSGSVKWAGSHPLHTGDTVATVISLCLPNPPGVSETLVLIRRGPEGISKRLIQISSTGRLSDPTQDVALRDGDELLFQPPTGDFPQAPNIP
ncbi:MAG: hypothetical protein ABSG31_15465 [Tepidisphaeraceae bacterium]|jgi:protein involved in polysaccharide export with SLBB domain